MVHQIGEQEMEREERRRHEPVVHRVERRTGGGSQDHHHGEKEQQAHRREERDPRGEGARVQPLRKGDANRLARQQVVERPLDRKSVV